MHIVRQDQTLDDKDSLFALALGPATNTSVAVWGGGARGFASLSRLYEAWQSWRVTMSVVAPESVVQFLPPTITKTILPSRNQQLSASDAWQITASAGMIVVGPDMQLTSNDQTLLARLLPAMNQPIILTDEALTLWRADPGIRKHSNVSLVASVETLLLTQQLSKVDRQRLAARGLFGVAEQMRTVSDIAPFVCAYGDESVFVYVRALDTLFTTSHDLGGELIRTVLLALAPITLFSGARGVDAESRVRVMLWLVSKLKAGDCVEEQAWLKIIRKELS